MSSSLGPSTSRNGGGVSTGRSPMKNLEGFSSQTISLRMQKKIAGKLTNRTIARHVVNEPTARVLDNLYIVLKMYYTKPVAEKCIKNMMKLSMKITILMRNNQLSTLEMRAVTIFIQRFRHLLTTICSFHMVEESYDPEYMKETSETCQLLLRPICLRHLTEKSVARLDMVFKTMVDQQFMVFLFTYARETQQYVHMRRIVNDLSMIMAGSNERMIEGGKQ